MGILRTLVGAFWWIAPFTFVFSLLYAVRETLQDGESSVAPGFIAAFSLLVLAAACILL